MIHPISPDLLKLNPYKISIRVKDSEKVKKADNYVSAF